MTASGWKNDYHTKVLNDVADYNPSTTYCMKTWTDAHHMVRYYSQYRNISRKVKQFLYGDRHLENIAIMWIKSKFHYLYTVETPVELVQPHFEQRVLGQGDRELELINQNSHPAQLHFYEANNKELQQEMEDQENRDQGETPLIDQLVDILGEKIHARKVSKGKDLNSADLHNIFEDVVTQYKVALGSQKALTPRGDFNDFAEARRPFIEPGTSNVSVKVQQ